MPTKRKRRDTRPIVAVDVDGVLAQHVHPFDPDAIGPPFDGAAAFTRTLGRGAWVLIHTCRPRDVVEPWLKKHSIWFDGIWDGGGKPNVAAFIDDRAIACAPEAHDSEHCYMIALDKLVAVTVPPGPRP